LWLDFTYCVFLKQQHRFANDPDGMQLYDLIYKVTHCKHQLINGGKDLTFEDIENMADLINNTTISNSDLPKFLALAPKAVVLRHNIRAMLVRVLVLHHAAKANTRAICWRSHDEGYVSSDDHNDKKHSAKKELDPFVVEILENESDNDTMPAVQYFYPGIPYRFISSEYPSLGWFKNGMCYGTSLILDHREPKDDLQNNFRVLRFPPLVTYVKIPHRNLGNLCGETIPVDCIPVVMKSSKPKIFTIPHKLKLFKGEKNKTLGNKVTVIRRGFPMDCVLTFTDSFAQGEIV